MADDAGAVRSGTELQNFKSLSSAGVGAVTPAPVTLCYDRYDQDSCKNQMQEKCRPNSQRGTRTSIETINRESTDGTCVGWQARWTVSLPAIVNNREKTMRL
jgi:hypothetical protein